MSAAPVVGPLIPSAEQHIHLYVCTKIRFQNILRRVFGQARLNAINSSVNPFIFPIIRYNFSCDVYVFILL